MGRAPEVIDVAADPELAWIGRVLAAAKERMVANRGSLEPVCFLRTAEELTIFPLGQVGDMNIVADRDAMAAEMRAAARRVKATELALLTDTFLTTMEDDEALDRFLDNPRIWRSWSPEYKAKINFRRREAISIFVELPGNRALSLNQFYRCRGSEITFEELIRLPAMDHGRFARMLPPADEEHAWADAIERFRTAKERGYEARITDAGRIELLRPDGSVFLHLDRKGNEANWERLLVVLRETGQLPRDATD